MIKYIKMKNMISNNKEIVIDFTSKYNKKHKDHFFDYSLKDKPRSEYKNGTLKTKAIIGKNVSYKSTTLCAISNILDFITNFKNNIKSHAFGNIETHKAFSWYKSKTEKDPFEESFEKILKAYWKYINKNKSIYDMKDQYIKNFYGSNCFNKKERIFFEVQFDKSDLNFKVSINLKNNKVIYNIKLNDRDFNILKSEKLKWFKHDFLPSFKLYNEYEYKKDVYDKSEWFLYSSFSYLYYQKFKQNQDDLLVLLQVLDDTIVDIKFEKFNKQKEIEILKITRKYNNITKDIEIDQLSIGTKMFLIYLYFILKNDFIIIDEFENSLHLKLVELLLETGRIYNKQIIFSTHSPFLLNQLLEKFEISIFETENNFLVINDANKLFRENESLVNKYVLDLVSNPQDSDLDFLRIKLWKK